MTDEPLEEEEPTTHLPVPSDRTNHVLAAVVVVLGLVVVALFGSRVYVLTENDQDQTDKIGQLTDAVAEANRRLAEAGEPTVSVPATPEPGEPGASGASGEPGEQGPPGVSVTGPPGPTGPRGPRGFTGLDSTIPGPTGQPGPTGAAGPPGQSVKGDPGPKGDQGAAGADGKDGTSGVVEVVDACNPPAGDVVTDTNLTYDNGTQTVTLSCTSEPQVLP